MFFLRAVLLSLFLFALPTISLADETTKENLEEQMSPEQFFASGLNKLSPEELATLNAFIQGKIEQTTKEVTKTAVEEHQKNSVGFMSGMFGGESTPDINSNIVGLFKGWKGKTRVTLANGQVWEQKSRTAELVGGVRVESPNITISQGVLSAWWAKIDGYNTKVKVKRIK